jgi:hypothetical protein
VIEVVARGSTIKDNEEIKFVDTSDEQEISTSDGRLLFAYDVVLSL